MDINRIDQNQWTSYRKGQEYFQNLFKQGVIPACSPGYISGGCAQGHKFAAPFLCGKEYCQDCGKDGSPIHCRRVGRWKAITDKFQKLGYLVFTFPKEVRFLFLDKKILNDFRFQLRRKLTRDGHTKGLARWHFFGDCHICNAKGCRHCQHTGAGTEWNPHLNIFIENGYMSDLDGFLDSYRKWAKNYILRLLNKEQEKRTLLIEKYGSSLDQLDNVYKEMEDLTAIIEKQKTTKYVIDYSYTTDKKKIVNRLKYVTRSTFRNYNQEVKEIIKNFRNSIRWGIKPEKGLILPPHLCPECKSPVRFYGLEKYHKHLKFKNYAETVYQLAGEQQNSGTYFTLKKPPKIYQRNFKRTLSKHPNNN